MTSGNEQLDIMKFLNPEKFVGKKVIVIGYGTIGKSLLPNLVAAGATVSAILEDKKAVRETISIYPTYETNDIREVLAKYYPDYILISTTKIDSLTMRLISLVARESRVPIEIVPERSEIHTTFNNEVKVRGLGIADIFARNAFNIDFIKMERFFEGKRVLITGAGGSIGSRIASQLSKLGVLSLALLDRDDCLLHDIAVEISGEMFSKRFPIFLCDIQDSGRIMDIFDEFRPEIVIHAAALKHVTTLETYPQAGMAINVLGTLNIIRAAEYYKCDCLLNISTDKAASGSNVLGLTKYIGERMTAAATIPIRKSVRFGNVLGSRGSVLQTFEIQARIFKRLTVRGTETTRFFMTPNEAASLSLTTLTSNESSGTYVLDMDYPVKIIDLAEEVAKMSPEKVDIEITSLLSGEAKHEKLFRDNETPESTKLNNVYRVLIPPLSKTDLERSLPNSNTVYSLKKEDCSALISYIANDII